MEVDIRYVQLESLDTPAKWANRPGAVVREKNRCVAILCDGNHVRMVKLNPKDAEKFRPVPYQNGVYPVDRFIEKMIETSKTYPATKATRTLLMKINEKLGSQVHTQLDVSKPGSRGSTIMILSDEFKLDPKKVRKFLRLAGLHAPYEDGDEVRAALRAKLDSQPASGRARGSRKHP